MRANPQKPFAYLPKPPKKLIQPLHYKWATFPSNYVAMCIYCLVPYQKAAKLCKLCKSTTDKHFTTKGVSNTAWVCCHRCERRLTCTRCSSPYIKKLTFYSTPWVLLPPKLPSIYGFKTYLEGNTAFHCKLCGVRYASLAIYSALCACEEHKPKTGTYVCRYCCTQVDSKLLKAIDKSRRSLNGHKPSTDKTLKSSFRLNSRVGFNFDTFMQNVYEFGEEEE